MSYIFDLNEIIKDVRECDRRLIKWLKTKGVLKSDEYCLIHRPTLVKIRVWVMNRLGIVDVDENGNVTLIREPPSLDMLPINSDLFDQGLRKPYLFYLIYAIIRDYKPRSFDDIREIFNKLIGTNHSKDSIAEIVRGMIKLGVVRRVGTSPKCSYYDIAANILTEDYEYYAKVYREDRRNARFIERAKAKRSG